MEEGATLCKQRVVMCNRQYSMVPVRHCRILTALVTREGDLHTSPWHSKLDLVWCQCLWYV